ncbi:MAG: ClpXP protease specificity-enhancing factor [Legionellaceae bacterium]|nr:ClpXP protease specificity-enhancing factor [Legionellaceae bacterium]
MTMTSNKPYFIRAIYDWIVDNDLTPYLLVDAGHPDVEVPQDFVSAGRIVLNISPKACRGLHLENDRILFTARFSGQTTQIFLAPAAVLAIYAKENGRGMEFGPEYDEPTAPPVASDTSSRTKSSRAKPVLTLVKQDINHEE